MLLIFIAACLISTSDGKTKGENLTMLKERCHHWPFERGVTSLKLISDITDSHFYSSSEVPNPDQVVNKRLSIRDDFDLDDRDQSLTLSAQVYVKYVDKRLALSDAMYPDADCLSQNATASNISHQEDAVCLGGHRGNMQHTFRLSEVRGRIWLPLVVNVNLKSADSDQDSMVRIDVCTGTVYFRAFSRFTVSCHLRYEWYPFDEQSCTIVYWLRTYEYGVDPVLDWHRSSVDGRAMPPNINKVSYTDNDNDSDWQNWEKSAYVYEREANCTDCRKDMLMMSFRFKRKTMSYMIQTILPSMMMAVCSYGSLFIPHDQVPGRMALSITTTLTLVTLSNGLFNTSPRTSYLKAIDVWLLVCFLFSVTVLVEFCVIVYFCHRHTKHDRANTTAPPPRRSLSSAAKFEQLFRAILPIAFAVFCAAFAAAVTASGDGDEVGAVPGHTVAEMEEKVVSIKGDAR